MVDKIKLADLDRKIKTALALYHEATDRRAPAAECWALDDKLNGLRAERANLVCQAAKRAKKAP